MKTFRQFIAEANFPPKPLSPEEKEGLRNMPLRALVGAGAGLALTKHPYGGVVGGIAGAIGPKRIAKAVRYMRKKLMKEDKEQETIKKYVKKRRKEGNAKAAAYRKLYAKLGYKGNPGNHDLDESVREKARRIGKALKTGLKHNWKTKAALALTPGPFGEIAAIGMTARDAYRAYKGQMS